jgi:hypothetical protein
LYWCNYARTGDSQDRESTQAYPREKGLTLQLAVYNLVWERSQLGAGIRRICAADAPQMRRRCAVDAPQMISNLLPPSPAELMWSCGYFIWFAMGALPSTRTEM